jgi:hypothetical protein
MRRLCRTSAALRWLTCALDESQSRPSPDAFEGTVAASNSVLSTTRASPVATATPAALIRPTDPDDDGSDDVDKA